MVEDTGVSAGTCWGDFDNDGDLDLFVSDLTGNNNLYRNEGEGAFSRIIGDPVVSSGGRSWGAVWADFDNDGYLDLHVANILNQANHLFHNQRDGTFERVTEGDVVTATGFSSACAVADFDHDGYLDLCVANGGGDPPPAPQTNALYRNAGGTNAWLSIRLNGTVSNRSAVGAKIRLKANLWGHDTWQMRDISGGSGYCSQDDLRAHFGLGDASKVERIRIEWPSGYVQEFADVEVNQILTVVEPCRLIPQSAGGFQILSWIHRSFEVKASTDLKVWTTVATVTNETGTLIFDDTQAMEHACRYYRVVAK